MRTGPHSVFACLLVVALAAQVSAFSSDAAKPTLRERANAATGGDRAKLFTEAAHKDLDDASALFNQNNFDAGHAQVRQVVADAESACQAAIDSGKRLKQTEIEMHKLSRRLQELSRSLGIDERPAIDKA